MYKIGVCGHLAFGDNQLNCGQTDDTRFTYEALKQALGEENVTAIDTRDWKKNPVKFFFKSVKLIKECENVIILPAQKGVRVFPVLFETLNIFFRRKLHYAVIGGWLTEMVRKSPSLMKQIKKLDCIYTELITMKNDLEALGFTNIYYKPKFRETHAIRPEDLYVPQGEPYRVCTFSRISYEKGIEDAIEAVRYVNKTMGRTVYTLDIYGNPDADYKQRFDELQKTFEPYIQYKGFFTQVGKSSQELRTCFALLFPTWYEGEGFAGTVVDAFCAGVPIIATDWKYNPTVIRDGIDGIIYSVKTREKLREILLEAARNPEILNSKRANCLKRVEDFDPKNGIRVIVENLADSSEK